MATSGAWARGQADSGKAGASMKKETGVKLQFVHPAAGNQNEQLNLMLASGELPDMIHWGWKNFPGGPAKAIQEESQYHSTSHTATITSKEA